MEVRARGAEPDRRATKHNVGPWPGNGRISIPRKGSAPTIKNADPVTDAQPNAGDTGASGHWTH
jgi:hypothetical protein